MEALRSTEGGTRETQDMQEAHEMTMIPPTQGHELLQHSSPAEAMVRDYDAPLTILEGVADHVVGGTAQSWCVGPETSIGVDFANRAANAGTTGAAAAAATTATPAADCSRTERSPTRPVAENVPATAQIPSLESGNTSGEVAGAPVLVRERASSIFSQPAAAGSGASPLTNAPEGLSGAGGGSPTKRENIEDASAASKNGAAASSKAASSGKSRRTPKIIDVPPPRPRGASGREGKSTAGPNGDSSGARGPTRKSGAGAAPDDGSVAAAPGHTGLDTGQNGTPTNGAGRAYGAAFELAQIREREKALAKLEEEVLDSARARERELARMEEEVRLEAVRLEKEKAALQELAVSQGIVSPDTGDERMRELRFGFLHRGERVHGGDGFDSRWEIGHGSDGGRGTVGFLHSSCVYRREEYVGITNCESFWKMLRAGERVRDRRRVPLSIIMEPQQNVFFSQERQFAGDGVPYAYAAKLRAIEKEAGAATVAPGEGCANIAAQLEDADSRKPVAEKPRRPSADVRLPSKFSDDGSGHGGDHGAGSSSSFDGHFWGVLGISGCVGIVLLVFVLVQSFRGGALVPISCYVQCCPSCCHMCCTRCNAIHRQNRGRGLTFVQSYVFGRTRVTVLSGCVSKFDGDAILSCTMETCLGSGDSPFPLCGVDKAIDAVGGPLLRARRKALPILKNQESQFPDIWPVANQKRDQRSFDMRVVPGSAVVVSVEENPRSAKSEGSKGSPGLKGSASETPSSAERSFGSLKVKHVIYSAAPNFDQFYSSLTPEHGYRLLRKGYVDVLKRAAEVGAKTLALSLLATGLRKGGQNLSDLVDAAVVTIVNELVEDTNTAVEPGAASASQQSGIKAGHAGQGVFFNTFEEIYFVAFMTHEEEALCKVLDE
eukprot:gene260-159_t